MAESITPDPARRDEQSGGDDIGFRNVDEDATHDESPGPQGTGDDAPPPAPATE
jgi:hypothetical protein